MMRQVCEPPRVLETPPPIGGGGSSRAEREKEGGRSKGSGSSLGYSLAVQWLGLCAFTAAGMGSIPGRGTKIL